jgi:hypothetical protein
MGVDAVNKNRNDEVYEIVKHKKAVMVLAKNRAFRTRLPVQPKALSCFCFFCLWPKMQATRLTGGS